MNRLRLPALRRLIVLSLALAVSGCGIVAAPAGAPPPTAPALADTATPAVAGGPAAPGGTAADPRYLVSASALVAALGDANLRVVDMGDAGEYAAGHIPGAVRIDWSELDVTSTAAPSLAAWQDRVAALLGQRGISARNRVVVYDHGTLYGARLWWVLDQLGHSDKQILDGGLPAWQAAGGPVAQATPAPQAVTYTPQPRPDVLATESQVRDVLGLVHTRLVDARSPGEYAAGHIPGAKNVPFTTTAAPGRPPLFQAPDQLRALFAAQGVTSDQPVIAYCSTGVRAAVDYVALRLAGFDHVRVYTGSWAEWGSDPTAPVER